MSVAMQHDASRMVQAVLQFGGKEERRAVVQELCNCGNSVGGGSKGGSASGNDGEGGTNNSGNNVNVADLCKIQYAHFVVLKLIKYGARNEECVKLIVKVRLKLFNDDGKRSLDTAKFSNQIHFQSHFSLTQIHKRA